MKGPLKIIIYIIVFLFSFIFFVFWMFPVDSLRSKVAGLAEGFLGPSYQVEIGELDTYWLTGLELKEVNIYQIENGKKISVWKGDEIQARAGIFSLLFGNPSIRFRVQTEEARIQGGVQKSGEEWVVDGSLKDVNVGEVPLVSRATGLKLNSAIGGRVEADYNPKEPLRMKGEMELDIGRLSLKASKLLLGEMGDIPLPDLDLAKKNSGLKATMDKGTLNLDSFRLEGDDFLLELKGRIFLATSFDRLRLNLQGKFRFSPKIGGVIEPIVPEKFLKDLEAQKQGDGAYPLSVDGPISQPQIYSGTLKIFPFQ